MDGECGQAAPPCSSRGIALPIIDRGSAVSHPDAMQTEPRRSALGLMILCILSEEPAHPYRVQKLIRKRGKDRVFNVRSVEASVGSDAGRRNNCQTFDSHGSRTEVTLNPSKIPDNGRGRQHEGGWNFILGAIANRFLAS
jgi:hypothetical protein